MGIALTCCCAREPDGDEASPITHCHPIADEEVIPPEAHSIPSERSDRGRDLFEKRRTIRLEQEAAEASLREGSCSTMVSEPKTPRNSISIRSLTHGKWQLHGVYEDRLVKLGLEALDFTWGTEGMLEFRCRVNGSSALLAEALIRKLLTGYQDMKSTHESDVSRAQGDLKILSLRQLLKLRALCLDYEPHRQESSSAQASFIQSLDLALFEQLARQVLSNSSNIELDVHELVRLGFQVALIAAADALFWEESTAVDALPMSRWWAWWIRDERVFIHIPDFECTASFPPCGVLAVQDLSRPDVASDGVRTKVDWNIKYMGALEELSEFTIDSARGRGRGGTFMISEEKLQSSLSSLRKTSCRKS